MNLSKILARIVLTAIIIAVITPAYAMKILNLPAEADYAVAAKPYHQAAADFPMVCAYAVYMETEEDTLPAWCTGTVITDDAGRLAILTCAHGFRGYDQARSEIDENEGLTLYFKPSGESGILDLWFDQVHIEFAPERVDLGLIFILGCKEHRLRQILAHHNIQPARLSHLTSDEFDFPRDVTFVGNGFPGRRDRQADLYAIDLKLVNEEGAADLQASGATWLEYEKRSAADIDADIKECEEAYNKELLKRHDLEAEIEALPDKIAAATTIAAKASLEEALSIAQIHLPSIESMADKRLLIIKYLKISLSNENCLFSYTALESENTPLLTTTHGDSGGPAFVRDENGCPQVAAICRGGYDSEDFNAHPQQIGISEFLHIQPYIGWIQQKMTEHAHALEELNAHPAPTRSRGMCNTLKCYGLGLLLFKNFFTSHMSCFIHFRLENISGVLDGEIINRLAHLVDQYFYATLG